MTPATPPSTPFEEIFADYFDCAGRHYLVIGDRLSGWSDVFQSPHGSPQAGADGLIACLRNYFSRFGVLNELSSDGGPEFIAQSTKEFLHRWGVAHRLSSSYYPQSNGRAEIAVKSTKRLLRSNTGPSGTLNTDKFLRAMMQLRNTPDLDCDVSPAVIVFGRPIRDAFAFISRLEKFSNENVRPIWRDTWNRKEDALRERFHKTSERLNKHSRQLPTLNVGDRCYIQNQTGNYPKKWDRSGTVVEQFDHDSYAVKIDGTGRITRRNRRFLRKFISIAPTIQHSPLHPGYAFEDRPSRNSLAQPHVVNATPTTQPSPAQDAVNGNSDKSFDVPRVEQQADNVTPSTDYETAKVIQRAHPTTAETTPPLTVNPTKGVPHVLDSTPLPSAVRPSRQRRAPPRYEPESGKWIGDNL